MNIQALVNIVKINNKKITKDLTTLLNIVIHLYTVNINRIIK